jgi:hypothetical protein
VTGVMGQAATDQLWYCMSETLEEAVSQDGTAEDITEVLLLAKIKSLAVRRANVMVNQAKFLRLSQHKDEDCGAFISRLRGAAQVSNFIHECPHCDQDVSYSERMIAHQLVVSLEDEQIQEKVLTQVANQTPTLLELTTMIEALETGKRSTLAIQEAKNGPGSANKISEYQKVKKGKGRGPPGPLGVVKPQTSPPAVLGGPTKDPPSCKYCGHAAHGKDNEDRPTACSAYNSNCFRCGIQGHVIKVCKKELPAVNTLTEEITTAEIHDNYEGSFFYMEPERQQHWPVSRDGRKGSKNCSKRKSRTSDKRGTPGALGGGPDQPPGGPGGTSEAHHDLWDEILWRQTLLGQCYNQEPRHICAAEEDDQSANDSKEQNPYYDDYEGSNDNYEGSDTDYDAGGSFF